MEWVLGKKINGEEAGGEKMQSYVVADTRARFCLRTMAKQTTNDRTGKTHFPKLNRFILLLLFYFVAQEEIWERRINWSSYSYGPSGKWWWQKNVDVGTDKCHT